jgi:hypothetical protein
MNGNIGVVLTPGGLTAAERSRRAATGEADDDSVLASRPLRDVVAKLKRRIYAAENKQRVVEEAEVTSAATRGLSSPPETLRSTSSQNALRSDGGPDQQTSEFRCNDSLNSTNTRLKVVDTRRNACGYSPEMLF